MITFNDYMSRLNEDEDLLDLKRTPVKVVRFKDGKRIVKRTCLVPGFKYDPESKSCKKIPMSTVRKMKLGAKKRVRLMKSRMNSTVRKRKRSMRIRKSRMS